MPFSKKTLCPNRGLPNPNLIHPNPNLATFLGSLCDVAFVHCLNGLLETIELDEIISVKLLSYFWARENMEKKRGS